MKKNIYLQYVMNAIVFLLFAGSIAYSIFLSLHFPVTLFETMGIALLFYLTFSLFLHNRQSFLVSAFITALFILIYIWFLPDKDKFWKDLILWLEWIILYFQGLVPIKLYYVWQTTWLVMLLLSLISYVLIIKLRKLLFTLSFGIFILGVEWFLGHEQILPCIWLFGLSAIMLISSRHYHSISQISAVPDYGLWMAWTFPMALVVIFTAFLFVPEDTSGFKWQFLEDQVSNIRETWSDRFKFTAPRQPFRLTETGFSPASGELGGPVQLSDDVVLEVQSPRRLYLRGSILNEYTGNNWIDSIDDKRYKFSDFYWNSVRKISYDWDEAIWNDLKPAELDRFFPSVNAVITHVGIDSSVLFNVSRCNDISPLKGHPYTPYFNEKSETFTSRIITDKESYTLNLRVPNMDDNVFRQFLIKYVSESDMEQMGNHPKHQAILKHYTSIPDTVPSRVYELAQSITKGLSSPFEKAQALEDYLDKNFTYTIDPPYTPSGHDFVDYFLFELKQGYCTYFASAMAIMGRAVGLPTRYIEGFSMPHRPWKQDIYEVQKEHGHAWVEIYFPKVGWLPFDPTPREETRHDTGNSNPNTGFYEEEMYMDEEIPLLDIPEMDIAWQSIGEMEKTWWSKLLSKFIWFLIPLVLIMLVPGIILIWYRWRWRPVKKYSLNIQLRIYYKEILWLLELYNYPVKPGETPYKYANRVDKWLVNPAATMFEIADIVIKTELGSYPLNEEELAIVKQFYTHLEEDIINLFGHPWYIAQLILRRFHRK